MRCEMGLTDWIRFINVVCILLFSICSWKSRDSTLSVLSVRWHSSNRTNAQWALPKPCQQWPAHFPLYSSSAEVCSSPSQNLYTTLILHENATVFYSPSLLFKSLSHREQNGYRTNQGGVMRSVMGNANPNAQMGMGNTRGYGMNEQGHMGPRGGAMYGPGNRMNQMNPMHQMNQMNQMNSMNQVNMNQMNCMNQMSTMNPMNSMNQMGHPGMNPHQQGQFHGGGYGMGMTSPSQGSPGMNPAQQNLLGSPRIRGSSKMGPFSPGGKCPVFAFWIRWM